MTLRALLPGLPALTATVAILRRRGLFAIEVGTKSSSQRKSLQNRTIGGGVQSALMSHPEPLNSLVM